MRLAFCQAVVAALALVGCPGSLSDPERFQLGSGALEQCDRAVMEILASEAQCAASGCHGSVAPQAGLVLEASGLESRLVGVAASDDCDGLPLIDETTPENSLLYIKLQDSPPCGSRMPLGAALSDDDQACVLGWIRSVVGASSGVAMDAGAADASTEDAGAQ